MFWCDGQASESVLARYFDPKLGRFLTQDSYLGQIDEPPSLHRYLYANANPTRFVDPTGFTAEGAEFQGVLRETKSYFIDQAQGKGVTGILKGIGFGFLAGAVGVVEAAVGLTDEAATVAYAAPGVDVMGDPTGVESREELKKQVADIKETYYTIKEEGFGNALGRLAKNATNTVIAAATGDPRAIAQVTSVVTEIAGPGTVLKGSGALRAIRKGAGELLEGAGRTVRRGLGEATEHLPLRWSPDPGSNLGNLRRKATRLQGTGDATVGTGTTRGGMPRATSAWRQRYGSAAVREHHLTPQALLKDTRFTDRLAELGVRDAKAFIDRKVSRIPRALHDKVHAEGWNQSWKNWLDNNPQFTLKDVEAQVKVLMKEHKVPAGSRNFAKPYGQN